MVHERSCENCNAGCTGRHNADERNEEISGGFYLLIFAGLILAASMLVRWALF